MGWSLKLDMLINSLADQVAMGAGSQVCPCHYSVIWFMACAGNVSPGFPPYVLGLSMSSRPTSRPPSWLVRSLCPFVGHPGPGHLCHIIQGASYSELMKFKSWVIPWLVPFFAACFTALVSRAKIGHTSLVQHFCMKNLVDINSHSWHLNILYSESCMHFQTPVSASLLHLFWCRTLAGLWGFVLIQLQFLTNLNHARSIIHMSVLSQKAGLRLEVRCDVLHTWFAVG